MDIPIIGGAYTSRSKAIDSQECQNLYPEINNVGGKVISLVNTPGLKFYKSLGYAYEVRGMIEMGGNLYVVCGNKMFKLEPDLTLTELSGVIAGSSSGHVQMVENGLQVGFSIPGEAGYYHDGTSTDLIKITSPGFPQRPGAMAYQDGYGIVSKDGTDYWQYSASYDFSSWDALDIARTEGQPDQINDIISDHRELWLIGSKYSEVWYNSGAVFTFDRIPAAVIEMGGVRNTLAKLDNTILWLDNFGSVRQAVGYQAQRVSTSQIEYMIAQASDMSAYFAYTYSQEGHSFYILTDPNSGGKTFGYDITTGFWHTRASNSHDERPRENCYCFFDNKHILGDYKNGNLYELDLNTYDDNGDVKRAIRVSQPIHQDRKWIYWDRVELNVEAGVGLVTGQGSDPKVILQYSDDHGKTWSNERWGDLGKIGNNKDRVVWRNLGRSRERVFKFIISDPVKRVITGANAVVRLGVY